MQLIRIFRAEVKLWALCLLASICVGKAEVIKLDAGGANSNARQNGERLASAIENLRDGDVLEIETGLFEIEPKLTVWTDQDYEHGGGLRLSKVSNVTIKAATPEEPPVIFGKGVGNHLLIQACTNVALASLVFRGDRPDVVTNLFSTIFLNGPNEEILIRDCQFEDFGNHAISHLIPPMESKSVTVTNCVFLRGGDLLVEFMQDSDGAGVSGIGKGWVVSNNVFKDCVRGVEVEGHTAEAHDIRIELNQFNRISNIAIMVFPTSGNMDDFARIQILNNTVTNSIWVRDQPTYPNYYTTGVFIGGGKDILIQSNTIAATQGTGLFVTSSFCELKGMVIRGNIINRSNGTGVIIREGGSLPLSAVLMEGNEITLSGVRGADTAASDLAIVSNVFDANTWLGDFSALRIEGVKTTGVVVHDNIFTNSAPVVYQMRAIRIVEGVPPVWLAGNVFNDTTWTPIDAPSSSMRLDPVSRIRIEESRPVLQFTTQGSQLMVVWTTSDLANWTPFAEVLSDAEGQSIFVLPDVNGAKAFFKAETVTLSQ